MLFTVKKERKKEKAKMKRKLLILLVIVWGRWGRFIATTTQWSPAHLGVSRKSKSNPPTKSFNRSVKLTWPPLRGCGVHSPGHLLSLWHYSSGEIQELNLNSHPMAFTMCPLVTQVCFMPPPPIRFLLLLLFLCLLIHLGCGLHLALCYLQTGPHAENSFLWFSLCLSPNYKLNHSHLSSAYNLG